MNTKQKCIYIEVFIPWDTKECGIYFININSVPKGLDYDFRVKQLPQDGESPFSSCQVVSGTQHHIEDTAIFPFIFPKFLLWTFFKH